MRAAVTEAVGSMSVLDRPEPPEPGAGRGRGRAPRRSGSAARTTTSSPASCPTPPAGSQFPRVQGHEVGATIAALGPGLPRRSSTVGQRVALWPLQACGECYPCSVGRPNTCDNFELIGIHVDGGLQELLSIAARTRCSRSQADDAAVAAMAEPVSIAVRAVQPGRHRRPASAWSCSAPARSASACAWWRASAAPRCWWSTSRRRRLALSRELGAETLVWTTADEVVAAARDWAGPGGPPVAIDATGVPAAVRAMVDMVASAGRAVQVGMSGDEVPLRIGSLTEKELDLLGVSCCGGGEFAEAVAVVERNGELLAPADQPRVRARGGARGDAVRDRATRPT